MGFLDWFKPKDKVASRQVGPLRHNYTREDIEREVPRYPPFVTGIPVCDPVLLMETQDILIKRICGTIGLGKEETDLYILPLIEKFAGYAHLLPASQSHHHRGMGGLFHHSLEVAAFAAQIADGRTFAYGKHPTERKAEEPRWVVATFVAGLLHDIGKPASDLSVTNKLGDKIWHPVEQSLWEWGQEQDVDRYFLRWHPNRHGNHIPTGALLINNFVNKPLQKWLMGANPDIVPAMLGAIVGNTENVISEMVRTADSHSTGNDVRRSKAEGSMDQLGVPVERYILTTARRLLNEGTWSINQPGARVWVTPDGIFIVWKHAVQEILHYLDKDNVPGVPHDKDLLAEMLVERDLVIPDEGHSQKTPRTYFYLHPGNLMGRDGKPVWLECIKLATEESLFSTEPPPATAAEVRGFAEHRQALSTHSVSTNDDADGADTSAQGQSPVGNQQGNQRGDQGNSNTGQQGSQADSNRGRQEELGLSMPPQNPPAAGNSGTAPVQAPAQQSPPEPEQTGDEPDQQAPAPQADQQAAPVSPMGSVLDWLSSLQGEGIDTLTRIVKGIEDGEVSVDEVLGTNGSKVFLVFPGQLERIGKPIQIAKDLVAGGLGLSDPQNPLRKVTDIDPNTKGIVLAPRVSGRFKAILEHSRAAPQQASAPGSANKSSGDATAAASAGQPPAQGRDQTGNQPGAPGESSGSSKKKGISGGSQQGQKGAAKRPAKGAGKSAEQKDPAKSKDQRPPKPKREASPTAERIVDEFIKAVRAGKGDITIREGQDGNSTFMTCQFAELCRFAQNRCSAVDLAAELNARTSDISITPRGEIKVLEADE